MMPRVSLITLGVDDLPRSRRFYEALGLKPAAQSVESTTFYQLAGGVVLALWSRAALAEDAGLPLPPAPGAMSLARNVPTPADVDRMLRLAKAAGGQIVRPAVKKDWGGYSGYFTDPDGHLWEVAHNPFIPLDSTGGLALD